MSNTNHTPRDWSLVPGYKKIDIHPLSYRINDHEGNLIAIVAHHSVDNYKQEVSNAKTILRAPNMLQALKDMKSQLLDSGDYKEDSGLIESIQNQINLAE